MVIALSYLVILLISYALLEYRNYELIEAISVAIFPFALAFGLWTTSSHLMGITHSSIKPKSLIAGIGEFEFNCSTLVELL